MRVFLCGRDHVGWATDDDYALTRRALSPFANFVDGSEEAEVIHTVNWRALLAIPVELLRTRRVVAHVSHDVRAMLGQPDYLKVAPYIDCWIAPSRRAEYLLSLLGLPTAYIPYAVDTSVFKPLSAAQRQELRARLGLSESDYLIGSFQRDTEGRDLASPKLVKGPDIFLEIVRKLQASGRRLHVVLAGPRRMWLKRQLTAAGIPFTFVGVECGAADDIKENTLDHATINQLYNAIDLYIVASRLEGGPKAVLECAAAGTRIISSPVGQAPDLLEAGQLFRSLSQAASMVESDMEAGTLHAYVAVAAAKAQARRPEAVSALWRQVYENLPGKLAPGVTNFRPLTPASPTSGWRRLLARSFGQPICFDYTPRRGPWGGGNQFLTALSSALPRQGWRVRFSKDAGCGIVLLNSFHSKLIARGTLAGKRYVHRIDGPTVLIRGKDIELDQEIFRINQRIAAVSVIQSEWSLLATLELGFRPVNPVLIHNAADSAIFHPASPKSREGGRKWKLISTSWSDNPRKGGPIYKWLDDHLDWSRFDYTFVGRVSEPLRNIRVVEPVDSRQLAEILRSNDIYIAASDNDPCSNALIEGLSCGLPAIYLNRGGHPELVGFGGLGFDRREEIPALIDAIVADYPAFCRLVLAPDLDEVARRYGECFHLAGGRL
ncbi:MAG: glycosyltransferase [Rhodocyclaceae bacterium]|nr:glycosyltransferase [Rhodocyclaceae bacterium]